MGHFAEQVLVELREQWDGSQPCDVDRGARTIRTNHKAALSLPYVCVETSIALQLLVPSLLDHPAIVEHKDLVRVDQRGQVVAPG